MKKTYLGKLSLLVFLVLSMACVPESATTFNTVISSQSGDGMTMELDEDTSKKFSYKIPILEDSINPIYQITVNPTHGKLEGCDFSDPTKLDCTYVPDSNFNGVDFLQLKSKDGGIVADSAATIRFLVKPINDAPSISGSHTLNVPYNTSTVFETLKGTDIDGDQLQYIISKNPEHGTLSNCFLGNSRSCIYTPDISFSGSDSLKYKVKDSQGIISEGEAQLSINVSPSQIYSNSEQFKVEGQGISKVDIVWVIDNSGSMGNEQEALKANFASFINGFFVNGQPRFDFNMMVTTTEAYRPDRAKAVYDPTINDLYNLSSQAAIQDYGKFYADFLKAVDVGIKGSGSERSLLSIEENYKAHTNWFGGNDSLLVYIILTDEPEQSTTKSIPEWSNYIKGLKSDPKLSKVYSIINLGQDNGKRYEDLAKSFDTQLYSITSSFDGVLNGISADISSQTNSLKLAINGIVLENSLTIKINGTLIQASEYKYNAQAKAIEFVQLLPVNAVVDISYSYTL